MKSQRKRTRNKATKLVITFDEKKRADYLLGFKKRKDERRKKAKHQMQQMVKAEKKRIKNQLDGDLPQKNYQLTSHLVTVTDMSGADLAGKSGTFLGYNTCEDLEEPDGDEGNEVEEDSAGAADHVPESSAQKKKSKKHGRKRPHVRFTHTHHKRRKCTDKSDRMKVKRKLKKHQKSHSNS